MVKVIFKHAGYDVEVKALPAKRAQHYSNTGFLDGEVLRVYEFGEVNDSLIRVPTPIYSVKTTAYTLKYRGLHLSSVEDMKNYRIGFLRGVLNINEIVEGFDKIERLTNEEKLLKFLDSGRTDIIIAGGLGTQSLIIKNGYSDIIPSLVISENPLYIYLHKKHERYITIIDEIIKEFISNVEMNHYRNSFEKKYFNSINNSF